MIVERSLILTLVIDVPASTTTPTAASSVATATTFWLNRALPEALAGPTKSPTLNVADAHGNCQVPAVAARSVAPLLAGFGEPVPPPPAGAPCGIELP